MNKCHVEGPVYSGCGRALNKQGAAGLGFFCTMWGRRDDRWLLLVPQSSATLCKHLCAATHHTLPKNASLWRRECVSLFAEAILTSAQSVVLLCLKKSLQPCAHCVDPCLQPCAGAHCAGLCLQPLCANPAYLHNHAGPRCCTTRRTKYKKYLLVRRFHT